MRKLLLLIPLLSACGGWGYQAIPTSGQGDIKTDAKCYIVQRWEDKGFLGWSRYTYPMGIFCRASDPEAGK